MTKTQTALDHITQVAQQAMTDEIARGLRGIHEQQIGILRLVVMVFGPTSWEVVVFVGQQEICMVQVDQGQPYTRCQVRLVELCHEVEAAIVTSATAWE